MDAQCDAMSREAGLAAAHIGIGATALSYANHAEDAYYYQSFFARSIGFERTAKLALVIDHALNNGGAFPSEKTVRDFGHKLDLLLDHVDRIVVERQDPTGEHRLPNLPVHHAIISVLTGFASNVTRYYNLDFLTGATRTSEDVVSQWHKQVTSLVVAKHYTAKARRRDENNAAIMDALLSGVTMVRHISETGEPLRSLEDAALHAAATTAVSPYTRMYVLQIARFLAAAMSTLSFAANAQSDVVIPHLSDFYRIVNNDDKYFRQRRTTVRGSAERCASDGDCASLECQRANRAQLAPQTPKQRAIAAFQTAQLMVVLSLRFSLQGGNIGRWRESRASDGSCSHHHAVTKWRERPVR